MKYKYFYARAKKFIKLSFFGPSLIIKALLQYWLAQSSDQQPAYSSKTLRVYVIQSTVVWVGKGEAAIESKTETSIFQEVRVSVFYLAAKRVLWSYLKWIKSNGVFVAEFLDFRNNCSRASASAIGK